MKKFLISFYVSMLGALMEEVDDDTKKQLLITKNHLLRELSK